MQAEIEGVIIHVRLDDNCYEAAFFPNLDGAGEPTGGEDTTHMPITITWDSGSGWGRMVVAKGTLKRINGAIQLKSEGVLSPAKLLLVKDTLIRAKPHGFL